MAPKHPAATFIGSPGPGVDASGVPVIDPTANVIALVEAGMQRQDDLRDQEARYTEIIAGLRADHARELRLAEAARLDAIRAVDTNAVATANLASIQQATTLAGQVTASADALRVQVEQTRIQFAATLTTALEPLQTAIAELRQVQYQQAGERVAQTETKGTSQWQIGVVAATFVAVAAIVVAVLVGVRNTPKPVSPSISCSVVATGQACVK